MTIGERNKYIIRLHDSGATAKEIAERLHATDATVLKVIQRYRESGENIFKSDRVWSPEVEESTENLNSRERARMDMILEAYNFTQKRDLFRDTVCEGDTVKFMRDDKMIKGTVCDCQKNVVVVRDLHNPPCLKCYKGGEDCEKKCRSTYHPQRLFDICRTYWLWFNRLPRYSPTYTELTKGKGNEI